MLKPILFILCFALFLQPVAAVAGSTLRCGSSLVSTGDSRHQVRAKCGAPADQSRLGYRERVNRYGFVEDILVEEWIYGPRNGMYHFLRFEGGTLVKITSSR